MYVYKKGGKNQKRHDDAFGYSHMIVSRGRGRPDSRHSTITTWRAFVTISLYTYAFAHRFDSVLTRIARVGDETKSPRDSRRKTEKKRKTGQKDKGDRCRWETGAIFL